MTRAEASPGRAQIIAYKLRPATIHVHPVQESNAFWLQLGALSAHVTKVGGSNQGDRIL